MTFLDIAICEIPLVTVDGGPDGWITVDGEERPSGMSLWIAVGPLCMTIVFAHIAQFGPAFRGPPDSHYGVRIALGVGVVSIWSRHDCWFRGRCLLRNDDDDGGGGVGHEAPP